MGLEKTMQEILYFFSSRRFDRLNGFKSLSLSKVLY